MGPDAIVYGSVLSPIQVTGVTDATSISCNGAHCIVQRSDGTVMTWGQNGSGQSGLGSASQTAPPTVVPGVSNVVAVGTGDYTTLAVLADGTALGWGNALGYTFCDQSIVFNAIRPTPTPIPGLTGLRAADAGTSHSLFLHTNGTVTACGANGYGEVVPFRFPGIPYVASVPGISGATAISAGWVQSFALLNGVAPFIRVHPGSKAVQAGQPVILTVEAGGQAPLIYQWQKGLDILVDGDRISGAASTQFTIDPAQQSDAGSYFVQVANTAGLVNSVTVTLTVTCPAGDMDCDGFIDGADVGAFVPCLGGPGRLVPPPGCPAADFDAGDVDNDRDVDARDFARFQNCFNGDELPVDPGCGNP